MANCIYKYKGKDYSKDEFYNYVRNNLVEKRTVPKYNKIRFPDGRTASLIEGHSTLEEFKKQKEDRIRELENKIKDLQNSKQFQKLTAEEKAKTIEQVTKEHRSITALKDLAAKLAHRIGGKVRFENNPNADWKGYNQGMSSVLNKAYMTPDTPFHEILAHPIIRAIKKSNPELYQSLLKVLETGRGKEVFEQVKRDYDKKQEFLDTKFDLSTKGGFHIDGVDYGDFGLFEPEYFKQIGHNNKITISKEEYLKAKKKHDDYINSEANKYTLEEIQEESIVTLLGLMAADKLDAKKDATLISKLKELWKQISDFVRSLLRQDGIKIDELPITTTLNDLAEIMAYSNNKIILPGWKIEYDTPLGNKYETLEEVNNEIANITKLFKDLSIEDLDFKVEVNNERQLAIIIKPNGEKIESKDLYDFIVKDREYAQSREIIEEYKKINNIQYDPEEVYSRGQEFYHIHNAYSRNNVDTELWIQNLLETIQDKAKIGAKVEMSFATAPKGEVGKGLQHHNKKTKQTVYITAYPKSEDIEFVSQIDNHTSSFTDLTVDMIKSFTNQKNERVGIALTKSVPLRNLDTIQPNLATTIDNVAHHNEIVIGLTPYNFRISYEENVPYELKKLIDNFNKILDDKYGKLVKPEIKKPNISTFVIRDMNGKILYSTNSKQDAEFNLQKIESESDGFIYGLEIVEQLNGKQPTQTRENIISIQDVKNKIDAKKIEKIHEFIETLEKECK